MQTLTFAFLLVIGTLLGASARLGKSEFERELLDVLSKLSLEKRQDAEATTSPPETPTPNPPDSTPGPDELEQHLSLLEAALAESRVNPNRPFGEILSTLRRNGKQGARNRNKGSGGRKNGQGQGHGQKPNVRELKQLLAEARRQLDEPEVTTPAPEDPGTPAEPATAPAEPTKAPESTVVARLEGLIERLRAVETRLRDRLALAGDAQRPGLSSRLATLERQLAALEAALANARTGPSLSMGKILSSIFANEISQQMSGGPEGAGAGGRANASGLQNGKGGRGRGQAPGLQNEQGQGQVARLARILADLRQADGETPTEIPLGPADDTTTTAAPVADVTAASEAPAATATDAVEASTAGAAASTESPAVEPVEVTTPAPLPTTAAEIRPETPIDDPSAAVIAAVAPSLNARLEQTRQQTEAVLADLLSDLTDPELVEAVERLLRVVNQFYTMLSRSVTAVENGEMPNRGRPKKNKNKSRGRISRD